MWGNILKIALLGASIGFVWSDTNYRLNTTIKPSAYSIAITPYFDTGDANAFKFDGEVSITFEPGTSISTIKIHSEGLEFSANNITLSNRSGDINLNISNPLVFEEKYSFAHINLEAAIPADVEHVLKIKYKGPIRTDLNGFYRNYYFEKGVKKWLGATQMEPTHARKVFPCFDEPELKAVFTLAIDRPSNYKPSLANTKLQISVEQTNGYIRDIFYPTPRMSTYLVAFLVSEFDAVTNINNTEEFGIYSRPEAINQTQYAFDFGVRVVKALSDYYGLDYYSTDSNIKLDHIALPDFKAGAMENWGLVKYREALLLYVPEESSPQYKYRVAQIIAHETTHMWFGNLVTCHWWSNTWLNEGFANYFQDYITALIEPEVGSKDMLVIGSVYSAYDADDEPDSPPITNDNVNSPAEISAHFGTITYQKAGSVIRMIHHLIGDEAFKFGLTSYLIANEFESGTPDKLYTALNFGVAQYNSMSQYPDSDVTTVMSSWVSQAGHPILKVDVDYTTSTITLTQKRFYINSSHSSNELYMIPITYTVGNNPNFTNTKPVFIMKESSRIISVPDLNTESHNWVIFNIQETGLYRVNYDDHSWIMIRNALKEKRESIHYLNRAKIINDLFGLLHADEINFKQLLDVSQFLKDETEYAVWYAAIRGFSRLRNYYTGTDAMKLIDDTILDLMDNIITKLGYAVGSTDSLTTQKNRMQILQFACNIGHKDCIDHAITLFKNFRNNGTAIHPSLRPVSYCTGLRFGEASDYEFMWSRMSSTNVANEARTISEVLGCTVHEEKLRSYLSSMLVENSPIRTQDLTAPLTSVLSNYSNVDLVLDVLKQNMTLWKTVYSSMDGVLSAVASSLHTQADFTKFEAWLSSCTECDQQALASARNALSKSKEAKSWAVKHEAFIIDTLKNNANISYSSTLLVLIMVAFTLISS
ncbi:membrane alanyl aminopeptidase-like [Aricia agestis]|uniref:membrane alanyl aminopeptidase-like n=1 Tax=Aricia agestis TaxID=91739 RepID=UPI001C20B7E4|nr:membrane alanyl aminopeptidase-like [Aricia agestis]